MINGTNSSCKITNITISEDKAIVTLLIFASKQTYPSKSFRIYIKDIDKDEIELANNNVYWIDRTNSYSPGSNNVEINKYKEIIIPIDISNKNTSEIKNNRWVRNCYLFLIDANKNEYYTPAWSSDLLNLISSDFEVPEIKSVSFETFDYVDKYMQRFETVKCGKIRAKFNLFYNSEKDFNYNNSHINVVLNVKSLATDEILESKKVSTSESGIYNIIETDNEYELGKRVAIEIRVVDKNGRTIRNKQMIYRPIKKFSNSFIKTNTGVKRILSISVNTNPKEEHEGEFIWTE